MEHQEPSQHIDQSKSQPTVLPGIRGQARKARNPSEAQRAVAPRKRDRSASETPAFSDWVEEKNKNDFPSKSVISKAVDVIALPAVAVGANSEISVRIEKSYKVRIEKTAGQTHVTGDLHLVPWDKFKDVIEGLIVAVATLLHLKPEKILKEADIPASPNGIAYPAFRLTIPRLITDDEQRALNVTYSSFNQRMRGQDQSLTKDMFAEANPEAVIAGQSAAEGVRRKAGGRNLPLPLTVISCGSDAKPVSFGGRIGDHPDPERDEEPAPIEGKVVSVMTEDHKFEIRSLDFKEKKGKRVKSTKGKKFMINYSDKDHRAAVLKLPLGLNQVVALTVIPRVGRNKDKLMLKSIGEVKPAAGEADNSNTTQ